MSTQKKFRQTDDPDIKVSDLAKKIVASQGHKKLAAVDEKSVARNLKLKGYQYILILPEGRMPLYSKTMSGVTELLRTDLKDERVEVISIDDFLAR